MTIVSSAIFESDLVRVRVVGCSASRGDTSAIEENDRDTLVLPLSGVFVKHLSPTRSAVADGASALLFAAGRPHRISHPADGGDRCLALDFDNVASRDVLAQVAHVENFSGLEPAVVLSRSMMRHRAELARLTASPDAPIAVEEVAASVLQEIVRRARKSMSGGRQRADTIVRRRTQIATLRESLAVDPGRAWSLRDAAGIASSSPFHLARAFRAETGCSIHQYILQLRIARSLDLLLDGGDDLTQIALEAGFASHSHFSTVFRGIVGTTPRAFRTLSRRAIVKTRRNLKARTRPNS